MRGRQARPKVRDAARTPVRVAVGRTTLRRCGISFQSPGAPGRDPRPARARRQRERRAGGHRDLPLATEVETNNKIAAGPDGNMRVTLDSASKDVAKITPSGAVEEFELPKVEEAPLGIAAGPDGKLWVPTTNKVTSSLAVQPQRNPTDLHGPDDQRRRADRRRPRRPDVGGVERKPGPFLDRQSHRRPVGRLQRETRGERHRRTRGSLIVVANDPAGEERVDTFTTAGVETEYLAPGTIQGVAGAPGGQIVYTAPGAMPEQAGLISPPVASAPSNSSATRLA